MKFSKIERTYRFISRTSVGEGSWELEKLRGKGF